LITDKYLIKTHPPPWAIKKSQGVGPEGKKKPLAGAKGCEIQKLKLKI